MIAAGAPQIRIGPRARATLLRLAAFLALAAPAMAHAATYYVDNGSGSCSPSGPHAEAQPHCTIGAAVAAHNGPGVTILVKPGLYREQVNVNASGTSSSSFVIQALGEPGPGGWLRRLLLARAVGAVLERRRVPRIHGELEPAPGVQGRARLTPSTASPAALPANSFVYVSGADAACMRATWDGGSPAHAHAVGFGHPQLRLPALRAAPGSRSPGSGSRTHGESRDLSQLNACNDITVSRDTVTAFANSFTAFRTRRRERRNLIGSTAGRSDNNLHGIGFTRGAHDCIVRFNESMRNADPAIRRANGIYLNAAPNNTLYGNRLHHNRTIGIRFSGQVALTASPPARRLDGETATTATTTWTLPARCTSATSPSGITRTGSRSRAAPNTHACTNCYRHRQRPDHRRVRHVGAQHFRAGIRLRLQHHPGTRTSQEPFKFIHHQVRHHRRLPRPPARQDAHRSR